MTTLSGRAEEDVARRNGGLPVPARDGAARAVYPFHPTCGHRSHVIIPGELPPAILRRVRCDFCGEAYDRDPELDASSPELFDASGAPEGGPATPSPVDTAALALQERQAERVEHSEHEKRLAERVEAVEKAEAPEAAEAEPAQETPAKRERRGFRLTRAGRDPEPEPVAQAEAEAADVSADQTGKEQDEDGAPSRLRTILAVGLASGAVIGGLMLIQGGDEEPGTSSVAVTGGETEQARFIERPTFSLALPAGWNRIDPPKGAAFAAASAQGQGDATLWVERDPKLTFKRFEQRSLRQIQSIAADAEVTSRVDGPTPAASIVEIRGGQADDTPEYRVTLRASGDYYHYLATTLAPGGPPKLAGDVEMMHSSLLPSNPQAGKG